MVIQLGSSANCIQFDGSFLRSYYSCFDVKSPMKFDAFSASIDTVYAGALMCMGVCACVCACAQCRT